MGVDRTIGRIWIERIRIIADCKKRKFLNDKEIWIDRKTGAAGRRIRRMDFTRGEGEGRIRRI